MKLHLKLRVFPCLMLLLGYVLGHVFYPVLQLWSWSCQCRCPEFPHKAYYSRGFAIDTLRSNSAILADSRRSTISLHSQNHSEFIKTYLSPATEGAGDLYHQRTYRVGTPRYLAEEYSSRKKLLVAVVTAERYLLSRARAVYETWGQEVTQVMFFVGSDCKTSHPGLEGLPIVKLSGVKDDAYPPQRKVFAVLEYISRHYIDQYHWFMRADDDVYIRGKKLEKILDSLNPNDLIYLGRAGLGKKEDVERIGLLSHERYCMGGPGVVLSNAALRALAPFLDKCLAAVHFHNSKSQQLWYNEDVELGRCISRTVGVQCSTSTQGRTYFEADYNSAALNPAAFWFSSMFHSLITIHPLKQPKNLYSIHHFYQVKRLEFVMEEIQKLQDRVKHLCEKLPRSLAPPKEAGVLASCNNAMFTAPTVAEPHFFPKVNNQIELMPWKHFNVSALQDALYIVPQPYGITDNFRSELSQLIPILKSYLELNRLAFISITEGYTRYNPIIGQEYILDIRFTPNDKRGGDRIKRVRVTRPLSKKVTVQLEESENIDAAVNIIIPLMEDVDQFSIASVDSSTNRKETMHQKLILCVIDEGDNMLKVQEAVADYRKQHPYLKITVIPVTANSTFVSAVDSGMSVLEEEELVFIRAREPYVLINPGFFQACRRNTIIRKRIYFPIPSVVYDSKTTPLKRHWAISHSFNMACIYKSDYVLIATDAGSLLEQALQSKLEVFQAPEPELIHLHAISALQEIKHSELWY